MAAEQAPIPYVKPQVVARTGETAQEEQELVLEQARHPCLETMENISFIPNDANFGKDRRFCIITGPNLGGKSTYLRSGGHWLNFCTSFLAKIPTFSFSLGHFCHTIFLFRAGNILIVSCKKLTFHKAKLVTLVGKC